MRTAFRALEDLCAAVKWFVQEREAHDDDDEGDSEQECEDIVSLSCAELGWQKWLDIIGKNTRMHITPPQRWAAGTAAWQTR